MRIILCIFPYTLGRTCVTVGPIVRNILTFMKSSKAIRPNRINSVKYIPEKVPVSESLTTYILSSLQKKRKLVFYVAIAGFGCWAQEITIPARRLRFSIRVKHTVQGNSAA